MSETHDFIPPASRAGLQAPFGRRGLLILGFAVIAAGIAMNWGWLSAVGAAPLILSLAPCAAMCAFGLCMKGGSTSCRGKSLPADASEIARD